MNLTGSGERRSICFSSRFGPWWLSAGVAGVGLIFWIFPSLWAVMALGGGRASGGFEGLLCFGDGGLL